jgi:lipopolysaccharide transport system ATP-binding protein
MTAAIRIENLGKKYRVVHGQPRAAYRTLREAVTRAAAAPLRRLRRKTEEQRAAEEFWALKDVSFDVQQGEVIGIIGWNGAGKSTLLKILSRITKPTTGRVEFNGRVGSLLEVGSGFHPELTGRENIYLNGSILGMSRDEIARKFDEIVAFAEVERFLDTPVKRYSSGMYVRLAFAVAAHLEPEILIVDEVLAVGDQLFQERCIARMDGIAKSGRTVLFVSHQLGALRKLCTTGVVLERGQVATTGRIDQALDYYLLSLYRRSQTKVCDRTDRGGNGRARLQSVRVRDASTQSGSLVTGCRAVFEFEVDRVPPGLRLAFTVYAATGEPVFTVESPAGADPVPTPAGGGLFRCELPEVLLVSGQYRINAALKAGGETLDHVEGAAGFETVGGVVAGQVVRSTGNGFIYHPHEWKCETHHEGSSGRPEHPGAELDEPAHAATA